MRRAHLLLSLAVGVSGCRITKIDRHGPQPKPSQTQRSDAGFPADPVVCTDLGGTIVISGDGFAPMPIRLLTEESGLQLPEVRLRAEDGTETPLEDVSYDQDAKTLIVIVPAGMPPGTYDVIVENPNRKVGVLDDAVFVVPPPKITAVTTTAIPGVATPPGEPVLCTDLGGTWSITGDDFHVLPLGSGAPTDIPTVFLQAADSTRAELTDVTFVSSTELTVVVPTGLTAGTYDLIVINPSGCEDNSAVELVVPPDVTGIAPTTGPFGVVTAASIAGTAFRQAGDGTQPGVTLNEFNTGNNGAMVNVAWVSDTQVDGDVPDTLPVGTYDVTLTNPEGCSDTLVGAFTVTGVPIDLCSSVDPAFGWVQERTTIEICADNTNGQGLQSTPEVRIIIGGDEIPLIREAYLFVNTSSSESIMSAVVPSTTDDSRIVVGGPYDIKVVNPDGSIGVISQAFEVLQDAPPVIESINPGRVDAGATVTFTVIGRNFKDGTLGGGGPILTISLIAEDGITETTCGDAAVSLDTPSTGFDTATCELAAPATTGGYVVRVRHEDDGSFDLFAMLAVTLASRKLDPTTTTVESLNQARRAHGVILGTDDLGNRFLYAVGGEDASGSALASIEVTAISKFGRVGGWSVQTNSLPEGRTGVALAGVGRYLYAIGGSTDGSDPITTSTTLRAKILGADTAPVIATPTAGSSGTLAAGTYYYKVAAVMAAGTDNPLGETLPSDEESVRVDANGSVPLTWQMPGGAGAVDHFRIYRSPAADDLSGTEVLLHETSGSSPLTYTDDGTASPGSDMPVRIGSTGVWVPVAEPTEDRFDASATVVRVDADNVFLYVAGGRTGPLRADVVATVDWAALTADGSDISSSWQVGPPLSNARAEHILVPVSHALAETVPDGDVALTVVGGSDCARLGAGACPGGSAAVAVVESSAIDTTSTIGEPGAWASPSDAVSRVGLTSVVVNDQMYVFNGWSGSGAAFSNPSDIASAACSGSPCVPQFTGFSAGTLNVPDDIQYRSGLAFFGAFFYFVGGSTNLTVGSTSTTVVRGSY